jgi:hypothetical protein
LRWAGKAGWAGENWVARAGKASGLKQRLGQKGRKKEWFKRKRFLFFKRIQTTNSNQNLNSNTTK